jgi:hypothetical protein
VIVYSVQGPLRGNNLFVLLLYVGERHAACQIAVCSVDIGCHSGYGKTQKWFVFWAEPCSACLLLNLKRAENKQATRNDWLLLQARNLTSVPHSATVDGGSRCQKDTDKTECL